MAHPVNVVRDPSHLAVIDYLRRDRLGNVVPLKMISHHGDDIVSTHIDTADGSGVLLTLSTSVFPYDQATYADFDQVMIPVTDNERVTAALIPEPPDRSTVFKLATEVDATVICALLPVERQRAFFGYTTDTDVLREAPTAGAVRVSETFDTDIMSLVGLNGYSADEVAGFFADGAVSFTIHDAEGPLSVVLAFRNFEDVWEIGGIRTAPRGLRQGLSRHLTLAALHWLADRSLVPRYQVDESNAASIALAEACGLTPFMCMTHFTAMPTG